MGNPSSISLQLNAAVANSVCVAQAVAGAGNLTVNGSLATGGVATFDAPRRVLVASSGNNAAVVFTVTGLSRDGVTQSETITGLTAGTDAYTDMDYASVSAVYSSAACLGNITVGTNGIGSSEWIMDNFLASFWALSVAVVIDSGSATYDVEYTYDDPNKTGTSQVAEPQQYSLLPTSYVPPTAWRHPTLRGLTTSSDGNFANQPVMAHRVTVTAGTGQVTMQSMQAGIIS
jgi:hypothetical protein